MKIIVTPYFVSYCFHLALHLAPFLIPECTLKVIFCENDAGNVFQAARE